MRSVLVMDDDLELAEMMAEYLRPDGFAGNLADDGPTHAPRRLWVMIS